ncbi:MAG: hypothetical protein ISS31_02290 [Kiritimatiellae bacterium]|nr:hypothetical protein [Kiritimatiellia bacterium]
MAVPEIGVALEMRQFVVAFFDILGQRESLAAMGPVPSKKEDARAFEEQAARTLGAVFEFRRLFNEYMAAYIQTPPPEWVAGLASTDQQRVLECSDAEIGFQGFSDTLIVYLPVMNRHGRCQWRGIHALLAASAMLTPTLLSVGIPIRGGMEMGVGCEFVKGELYGPVLQAAYLLESKIAKYPRIVVGEKLAQFLDSSTLDPDPAKREGMSGEMYDRHMCWVGTDADGKRVVDYLGPSAQAMTGGHMDEVLRGAYAFARAELQRLRSVGDGKLIPRYERLVQYFESRT